MIKRLLRRAGVALLAVAMLGTAAAQGFPNRTVTMMVPYPAGGPSDAVARLVQVEYEKNLGQKIVVENLGGVSGALGIQKVLAAPADGYYQLLCTPMELVLAPMALAAVKFKPEDVRLASLMGRTSVGLVVRKDMPANTVDEFLAWAKGKKVSYASVGQGSLYHLMGERFSTLTGLDMLHVPYKAAVQIYTDLGGNQVDMAFVPIAGPIPGMIKDGRFKLLGVAATSPHPQFPNLAVLSAHKALPDFNFDIWIGLQIAKDTPEAVVQKLNQSMNAAIQTEGYVKTMLSTGSVVPAPMSLAELDRFYSGEVQRYRALFKSINLAPQ